MTQPTSTPNDLKPHKIDGLSRLSVVYLRNAINNPQWVSGLEDYGKGVEAMLDTPKYIIPKGITQDEDVLVWASDAIVPAFSLSDNGRDACRAALKKALENKTLPVNEHTFSLITKFSLKT